MNIKFEKMGFEYQTQIMEIYNYYVENSTAAFPESAVPEQFFAMLLEKAKGYPAYAVIDAETLEVAGFCMLSAYIPASTFRETAAVTYFIAKKYTGKGVGAQCLERLETEAMQMGIKQIVADVSTENKGSLTFHQRHGFEVCGTLKNIGNKLGRHFGIILLQKELNKN
jgi:phosphinothricin acetyltransferase